MNFQQLEYIVAVAQHGRFSRAANSCHVTQATLSGMIKKLEEELGFIIFDRSRQPVKTTDEGREAIDLARRILALKQDLFLLGDNIGDHLQGELRLGIIPTVANSLLPEVLPSLLSDHPDLDLHITEITTDEIILQLKSDHLDAGILATPLNHEQVEENVLYYEAMLVYGVNTSEKKYLSTKAIQDQKIWLLEEGNCFREQTSTICNIREKSNAFKNLEFEGSSFDTLINLTDRFGGYTLVPELFYNQMAEGRKSRTRHFEPPVPVREISLVYHRPYARKKTLDQLSKQITSLIATQLITHQLKSHQMEIIGI